MINIIRILIFTKIEIYHVGFTIIFNSYLDTITFRICLHFIIKQIQNQYKINNTYK